ncbi:calcium-binding protein [Microvirga sp. 2YAF29]|uniref:calcium-binding protein n=1 Tax=Microvirga sp. 2YAF29 TaxID=3233031 RepID=UPI003F9A9EE3
MATVKLNATYIGAIGDTGIYRVDLSQSGLASIGAISVYDDKVISGGTGAASGFDLDFMKVSSTFTSDPSTASGLVGDTIFDFLGGVVYRPGFLQPWDPTEPPSRSAPNLFGTVGANTYSSDLSTLGINDDKFVSLGEGGSLTALLNQALSGGGKYLYFGDDGGGNDGVEVQVSGERAAPAVTGVHIIGTDGHDTILLGRGINAHIGAGNDTIEGLRGNDRLFAAGGDDRLFGAQGNDILYGELGNDWLYGGAGNDRLNGGPGNDKLYGGAGKDLLMGGPGKDAFVFDTRPHSRANFDKILDYRVRDDSIWLENTVFKGIGRAGPLEKPLKLQAKFFWKGSEAHDADDRIIYDPSNGALYYDRDGNGAAAQVKFAQLKKGLPMSHHEFFVI